MEICRENMTKQKTRRDTNTVNDIYVQKQELKRLKQKDDTIQKKINLLLRPKKPQKRVTRLKKHTKNNLSKIKIFNRQYMNQFFQSKQNRNKVIKEDNNVYYQRE